MSYAHIGLYNTLRSLGATEDQAQTAVADLPLPQHLASKEDLLEAIAGTNDRIAALDTKIAEFRATMETRFSDKFAPLDRGMAVLKFGYGPIIVTLLVKLAFFP